MTPKEKDKIIIIMMSKSVRANYLKVSKKKKSK